MLPGGPLPGAQLHARRARGGHGRRDDRARGPAGPGLGVELLDARGPPRDGPHGLRRREAPRHRRGAVPHPRRLAAGPHPQPRGPRRLPRLRARASSGASPARPASGWPVWCASGSRRRPRRLRAVATRRIDTGEIRLAVAEAGDPSGEPVDPAPRLPGAVALLAAPAPGAGRRRLPRGRARPARLRRLGPPRRRRGLRRGQARRRRRRAHRRSRPRERPPGGPRLGRRPRLGPGRQPAGAGPLADDPERAGRPGVGAAAPRGPRPAGQVLVHAPVPVPRRRRDVALAGGLQEPPGVRVRPGARGLPARGPGALRRRPAPRRRPDRGAQLVPGQHAAGRPGCATRPTRRR